MSSEKLASPQREKAHTDMNGLARNYTARSRGYEQLDRTSTRSETLKKVDSFPLRTAKDEARQRRQLYINSYKFETEDDKPKPFVCCRKMGKVVSKVKTSVRKLVSSVKDGRVFRPCNCRLAVQVFSPKPRNEWF